MLPHSLAHAQFRQRTAPICLYKRFEAMSACDIFENPGSMEVRMRKVGNGSKRGALELYPLDEFLYTDACAHTHYTRTSMRNLPILIKQ